jgi:hypothetical protein
MTALVFNHLWQSTLFAGVIAILTLAVRHNRARLRYGLWLAASVKFLVPFTILAAVGGMLEWPQAPASIRSVVASPGVRDFNAPFAAMSATCDAGTTSPRRCTCWSKRSAGSTRDRLEKPTLD